MFVLVLAVAAAMTGSWGQTQSDSLGDVARAAKHNRSPHAKVTLSDEDPRVAKGPFSEIATQGTDNSDEIIKSITDFAKIHSPAETETAIHTWYDKHDLLLKNAIEENIHIKERDQDRALAERTGYPDVKDYQKLRAIETAAYRDSLEDYRRSQMNGLLSARIQQAFTKVRFALQRQGLKYDWMKIRFGNGNGSW